MRPAYNGPWPEGTESVRRLAVAIAAEPIAVPPWAQARVWARVLARRERARRVRLMLAVAMAPAMVAVLVGALALRSAAPSVVSLAGARWSDGARRAVDIHGAARVVVGEGSNVSLVEDDARGLVFEVARGSLLAHVAHRPEGAPMWVRTPAAEVKVVGTTLWVDVDERGAPTVAVAHGTVEVTPKAGASAREPAKVMVRGGERWPFGSTREVAAEDVSLLGADALEGGRFAAAPPAPPPAVQACDQLPAREAIACLSRLAADGEPLRAESALYQIGWVELRDLGDARAALSTWQRQRARFPGGVLRAEADVSIIEVLVRLGERARARREIDGYLAAHPDGIAAPERRRLRDQL
jgi:hypothetical protein